MNQQKPIHEKLAHLEAICREKHIPVTVQRRAILESLVGGKGHPTAEDVIAKVEEKIPGVAKATVYRTLERFAELGLVERVAYPGSAARYDAVVKPHHHLFCTGCGEISDLQQGAIGLLHFPDHFSDGFQVSDYSLFFRGVCKKCRPGRQTNEERKNEDE